MAAFPNLVLTNAGIALQNKVQGGTTLELTNIQMGSGQLNGQPIGPLTALISSNATVPIQGGQAIGQNTYQVEGFFTNADLSAGFWWREIGIFANDPDKGEILYAYANAGDAGDYIPTVTDQRIEKYIYFSMALANATTVNVTIPQTDTFVLKTEVGQPNGVAGLDENGAVPVAQGGTGETTVQGVVDAFGIFLAISAAAAYDPEGSYAVGDYCTHGGKLHKCNTPIPSGEAWNAEHWTATTVAAELAEVLASLSNKASKLGDTLTGTLTLKSQNAYTDNAWQTSGLGFVDGSNTRTGWLGVDGNGTDICDFWLANDKGDVSLRPGINGRAKVADADIATTTPPAVRNLTLQLGFTVNGDCTFFITQESEVHLAGGVSGTLPANQDTQIGTLPANAHPVAKCRRPAVTNAGVAYIDIHTDGTVWAHPFAAASQCWFDASFVAGGA